MDDVKIIECVNGRDYLSLDLSSETSITMTMNDRRSTTVNGATRLVHAEVGQQLYDALGAWLKRSAEAQR